MLQHECPASQSKLHNVWFKTEAVDTRLNRIAVEQCLHALNHLGWINTVNTETQGVKQRANTLNTIEASPGARVALGTDLRGLRLKSVTR
eukprot:3089396-Amphidinium_carterae.1